jgi:hypothetical protein
MFKFSHSLLASSLLVEDRIYNKRKADYTKNGDSKKLKKKTFAITPIPFSIY